MKQLNTLKKSLEKLVKELSGYGTSTLNQTLETILSTEKYVKWVTSDNIAAILLRTMSPTARRIKPFVNELYSATRVAHVALQKGNNIPEAFSELHEIVKKVQRLF